MSNERQVREIVARCVSIIVYYHNSGPRPKTKTAMVADVQAAAGVVARWGLGTREIDEWILGPVEAELLARYGHELGFRLNNEFVGAFEGIASLSQ